MVSFNLSHLLQLAVMKSGGFLLGKEIQNRVSTGCIIFAHSVKCVHVIVWSIAMLICNNIYKIINIQFQIFFKKYPWLQPVQ